MIKFFRKIRQKMLTENKFSKYLLYAIGEIILVVIGILIALQINNWNQNRLERHKEQTALNLFYKDFVANDSIIKEAKVFYENNLVFTKVILRHTGPNATVPKDSITRDSLFGVFYPKVNLVYNSLNISSQQIDILTDDRLKLALSKFPSIYFSYKEGENLIKDLTIKQRLINKKYISLLAFDPDFDQENFKSDLVGLLRNREYQNTTIDKKWVSREASSELEILNKKNQMILKLIKKNRNEKP